VSERPLETDTMLDLSTVVDGFGVVDRCGPMQLQVLLGRSRKLSCPSQLVGYSNRSREQAARRVTTKAGRDARAKRTKARTHRMAVPQDRGTESRPAEGPLLSKCHGKFAL
jgi:hypothetical protein